MGIGNAVTLVSCLAGLMLALPAMMIFLSLLFNRTTTRAAERLYRGAITPFFVGLIPTLLIAIPSSILLSLGSVFQLCGTLFWFALLMWAFTGLASVGRMAGMRLHQYATHENPMIEIVGGSFLLTFAVAFPILGWLIILPISLVTGIGATVLALFRRSDPSPDVALAG